jgi:hypothetical protein
MIPSRPLDLGGIIVEATRIAQKTFWRAALVLLIFCAPAFLFIHVGIERVVDGTEFAVKKCTDVAPDAPILIRDYIFLRNSSTRNSSISYFRLQYHELYSAMDSLSNSLQMKYPDSASVKELRSKINTISRVAGATNSDFSDRIFSEMLIGLVILAIGLVLLILGLIGSNAARYDLASRAFEEREFPLKAILALVLKRNLWYLLVQYFMIGLAMLFGFGMIIGITYAISDALGAVAFVVSIFVIIYAVIRILFSGVTLVSEELGPFDAIKRSLAFTSGSFWRIFGTLFVGGIVVTVVSTIIRIPFSLIFSPNIDWLTAYIRGSGSNISELFGNIRSSIRSWELVYVIISLLTASFSPSLITTFYYDLRTRKDGVLAYDEQPTEEVAGELPKDPPEIM